MRFHHVLTVFPVMQQLKDLPLAPIERFRRTREEDFVPDWQRKGIDVQPLQLVDHARRLMPQIRRIVGGGDRRTQGGQFQQDFRSDD